MNPLKQVMLANAGSCFLFGLLFVLIPGSVIEFLRPTEPVPYNVLRMIGAVLIVNGFHLVWASGKEMPNKRLIIYFSLGDLLWVLGTVVLLILGVWITSFAGIIFSLLIAVLVAAFGLLQIHYRFQSPERWT